MQIKAAPKEKAKSFDILSGIRMAIGATIFIRSPKDALRAFKVKLPGSSKTLKDFEFV